MKTLPAARTPDLLTPFTQVPTTTVAPGKLPTPDPRGDRAADWLRLDVSDEAKRAYREDMGVADQLARGAAANKKAADQFELQAAKERLRLLKLLAQQAIASGDAKLARSIAKEVGEIARRVGNLGGGSGGAELPAGAAAEGPEGSGQAGNEAAAGLTAAAEQAPAAEEKTAEEKAAAMPTLGDGAELSFKEEVRELLKLAKKILDKLRQRFGHDRDTAKEINKAERRVFEAAEKFGINLTESRGATESMTETSFTMTVTQTVEVIQIEASVSIDIKV